MTEPSVTVYESVPVMRVRNAKLKRWVYAIYYGTAEPVYRLSLGQAKQFVRKHLALVQIKRSNMQNEATVKKYMRVEILDHIDPKTGEANPTGMAEDACSHFGDYGPPPDYDIPEEYFDWALEVTEAMGYE